MNSLNDNKEITCRMPIEVPAASTARLSPHTDSRHSATTPAAVTSTPAPSKPSIRAPPPPPPPASRPSTRASGADMAPPATLEFVTVTGAPTLSPPACSSTSRSAGRVACSGLVVEAGVEGWRRAASDARLDWGQENTLLENTFCSKRTRSRVREHILLEENDFCE